MPRYIDGFVIPIPTRNIATYRRIARQAATIWRDHGALQYLECVGEDLATMSGMVPFPKLAKVKPGETVLFSWILYKSRAHRDRVNAKVMQDPRMLKMMDKKDLPFDWKRMAHGGFSVLVER